MIRLIVNPSAPDPEQLERAAVLIRGGGVVAIPTDTIYGLAADPFNDDAVRRVYGVKDRMAERALPLIGADFEQIVAELGILPPTAQRLAERFWPGPLTLVVTAPERLSTAVTGGTNRVGVRIPAHPVAQALCRVSARLLTATSANVSGQPPSADPDVVHASLGHRDVDALLDAGRTPGGEPSTVVDVSGAVPRLLRAGAVPWEDVRACVR
jgi:L-threonylcarbamoyladenylate synthase